MGGGGGGSNGCDPGGGGGYVSCGTFIVANGTSIPIIVGTGGAGGAAQLSENTCGDNPGISGTASAFGSLLSASGGQSCKYPILACDGGTGSGAFCMATCSEGSYAGAGGTSGSGGQRASNGAAGGSGQNISYTACLQLAVHHQLTAGAGGAGGIAIADHSTGNYQAAGGGGGVLLDGNGPAAGDGTICYKLLKSLLLWRPIHSSEYIIALIR